MDGNAWLELVKLWGPLSLGWVAAAYMGKFIMDRYDRDIDSRVKMAASIDALTRVVERMDNAKNP